MLNFDMKRKIQSLRDILVGKIPDPKAQVEQITIAMIYKFMDDIDLQGIDSDFGGQREFFQGEYEKYAWTNMILQHLKCQSCYKKQHVIKQYVRLTLVIILM